MSRNLRKDASDIEESNLDHFSKGSNLKRAMKLLPPGHESGLLVVTWDVSPILLELRNLVGHKCLDHITYTYIGLFTLCRNAITVLLLEKEILKENALLSFLDI